MTLETQLTREGNLLIKGDDAVVVKAQKDSNEIFVALGNSDADKATMELIKTNRSHYADLTPNMQNLSKLFDIGQSSADSFYAEQYVLMKEKLLKANELANAPTPQVDRYTVTARDL
ncbi:hypothetical protein ACIQ4I_10395 [Rummeliibacillus sp. NPDC094406]|uniref:hypothetical protein n=1 Tax=Rummeliibacillus sp. NPDC094406 TaxID=3364511 RepID=UPI00382CD134